MKHISILIPQGTSSLSNIEGAYQILNEVNNILMDMDKPPVFEVQLVGIAPEARQRNGLFTVRSGVLFNEVEETDLIIIPAMQDNPLKALDLNHDFIPWVIKQYQNGAEVASFCVGAFFLAATGLLKGKQCATHWRLAGEFRQMYPDVNLVDDKIMTAEDGIYTSGGAYSYLNLVLYLVEKYAGRDMAILIAKTFMIDIDRNTQSPFIIFKGQKTHDDEQIIRAQEYIEENYQEKITVDQLADLLALGRRNLERRFKKATSNTVIEYIQRVKIEAAKKRFESSRKNINEVMYEIGYSDTKAFRTIFRKVTGLSPVEYRNKYNKEGALLN
ncbi:GlxA family transcriptional regulator [Mucilaginibacter sp. KACC 22063]|uniref:GlxA family transcriptional regulator n=1 Tax=Mucilaginibacter sp. KACC 22063 TaxID=3025666 RepID=UPI0023661724|nr:helix-turn-helix domain-containing protein [Mucilaginibacter sp. KACC 22063]WDF55221.1 helix-turn-helix domain-containing protein [Mucilaginibacter sp. KACC 22063]